MSLLLDELKVNLKEINNILKENKFNNIDISINNIELETDFNINYYKIFFNYKNNEIYYYISNVYNSFVIKNRFIVHQFINMIEHILNQNDFIEEIKNIDIKIATEELLSKVEKKEIKIITKRNKI